MRRRPERCVVGVTRIWRRAGVRHEVMRQKLWALRCASSGVMGTRARRPPGTLGGALATCLGGEPVRATRRVGNRSRPGSASLGAPRPSADRRHECSAFPASWPSSERIGGSAISVIKTLRLLVADLAQKTGQNCTKMPARRCPRMLALLLAAAAPAAVSSEAAHEWAGPCLRPKETNQRARVPGLTAAATQASLNLMPARPTPGGRRRCAPASPRAGLAQLGPPAGRRLRVGGRFRPDARPQVRVDRAEDGR